MLARTHMPQTGPLFDKYGGLRALRAVIIDFYDRVLDSDVVGHFFEDVDIAKLIDHQTKFFTAILGGPAEFADQRLAVAHAHLNVTHAHFDEIVTLLDRTLSDAGFTLEDLDTTLAAVEARRSIIVR
ncbi:group 1 truncated hemoglobin [uncultured Tateyamaria sp.]|uniref:group I truncated hemoglobin n=1 Tax=uncultured Tateyamaria sp. TaxID=455651 RepID=UPI002610CCE1|nr:group 1 truncated hemoglobin [uncultured Tateyamaria sp.]